MKVYKLTTPLTKESIAKLKAGDKVLLSGKIITARDQAHMRLIDLINKKKKLPIDINNQIIYYTGPSPAKSGDIIGACGPTTSARMDGITEPLLKKGLKGTIGKGERSKEIQGMIKKYKAPYLVNMGGGGALLNEIVISSKIVAFKDLSAGAIRELTIKNMPLYVAYDIKGGSIYNT